MSTAPLFKSRPRSVFAAAALASAALVVGTLGVIEGSAPSLPSVRVVYTDLNLKSGRDAQQLYTRLQLAAVDVCAAVNPHDLAGYVRWQACYDQALRHAIDKVDAPKLLALYHADPSRARRIT
jgi:UrcA family protein